MNWFWRHSAKERFNMWRDNKWHWHYCSKWCLLTDTKLCGAQLGHGNR